MRRKTRHLVHLILCLILLALSVPGIAPAATERRTALVIGNSSYNTDSLRNPVNDADDMAAALKRLGFDVILKRMFPIKTRQETMRNNMLIKVIT